MTYIVKEVFRSLQGEGGQTGRVAVFIRFAGCNLWSGREQDRATARCTFCDTDFKGGQKFHSSFELADLAQYLWHHPTPRRLAILTGGEPLLQVDGELVHHLKARGFEVALETNGTIAAPPGLDWICVSPKTRDIVQLSGDELKFVYPQVDLAPEMFAGLDFRLFSLSPMDGPDRAANTAAAVQYCFDHPQWQLTLQTHKLLGLR